MFEYLEKLRQKPERVKKHIAFTIAFFLAGVVFVVWLTSVYPDFSQSQSREAQAESLTPSPLSTFEGQLSSGISAISEKFSEVKNSISSFSTGPLYYNATNTATTTD